MGESGVLVLTQGNLMAGFVSLAVSKHKSTLPILQTIYSVTVGSVAMCHGNLIPVKPDKRLH